VNIQGIRSMLCVPGLLRQGFAAIREVQVHSRDDSTIYIRFKYGFECGYDLSMILSMI
jgi:hypothetical protein